MSGENVIGLDGAVHPVKKEYRKQRNWTWEQVARGTSWRVSCGGKDGHTAWILKVE